MRNRFIACIATAVSFAVAPAIAQQAGPAPPVPRPTADHARLGFFVGDWTTQSEIKPGPWGPGTKLTGREKCTWMEGRFFVLCNTELEGEFGKLSGHGVMGFDPGGRRYMRAGFHSDGQAVLETGEVAGATWTFSSERSAGNMTIRNRVVFVEKPPGRYDFRIEISQDGTRWETLAEGSATRRR
jgi:hypothetical protein